MTIGNSIMLSHSLDWLLFEVKTHKRMSSVKPKTHRTSAAAANAGLWWCLGMGLGLIFKRHHRLAMASDADARRGYTLTCYFRIQWRSCVFVLWYLVVWGQFGVINEIICYWSSVVICDTHLYLNRIVLYNFQEHIKVYYQFFFP